MASYIARNGTTQMTVHAGDGLDTRITLVNVQDNVSAVITLDDRQKAEFRQFILDNIKETFMWKGKPISNEHEAMNQLFSLIATNTTYTREDAWEFIGEYYSFLSRTDQLGEDEL